MAPRTSNRRTNRTSSGLTRRQFITSAGLGTAGLFVVAACGNGTETTTTAGTGTTAAGAGTTAASPTPAAISVAMGWVKNVEYGGSWLALDRGFYEQEAINAIYNAGGPNAPAPGVSVASGDSMIGVDANFLRVIDTIREGNDFVIFGAQFQRSPSALLSLADNPIRTAEDLIGKRLLGQDPAKPLIDAIFTVNGLPLDYEFIPVGFTPDPLIEGQGDVMNVFAVNQPIALETQFGMKEGEDFVVTLFSDVGLLSYSNVFFTSRSILQEHGDELARFIRATIKGWELNRQDPAVAAELAVNEYGVDLGLDLAQQTRQNELQIPLMESDLTGDKGLFWVDPEVIAGPMYDWVRATGRDDLPDVESFVDTSVLETAYGGATSLLN